MRDRVLLVVVALLLLVGPPAFAEEGAWLRLSSSVNYTVGDYGTDKDTTICLLYTSDAADE